MCAGGSGPKVALKGVRAIVTGALEGVRGSNPSLEATLATKCLRALEPALVLCTPAD
jgi:hypothetical protein